MKKMTIALFTAAAMGTSVFAVADEHGPTISGDIRFIYNDNNTDTQDEISNNRLKLAVSGAADAGNGNEAFYYFRQDLAADDEDDNLYYKFIGMRGDFGSVQAGVDDDLVYKFAGARTDLFRGQLPGGSAAGFVTYSTGFAFEEPSVQYSTSINDLTIAAYADTSAGDGVERTQAAASYDFGPATVAGVYSNSDDAGSEDLFGSISMDLSVATLGGSVGDLEDGTNPVSITLSGDVTETLSAQVGYADNDNGTADTIGQVIANLGGGMSVFGNYRSGDSEDGFVVGAQLNY